MKIFCIADIAIRQDAQGRYCLNDLHKAAVASGANKRSKEPAEFFKSKRTQELLALLEQESATPILGSTPTESATENWGNAGPQTITPNWGTPHTQDSGAPQPGSATEISRSTFSPVSAVDGGPYEQRGTYVCLELVIAYGQFVSAAFDLKVIRTFLEAVDGQHARPHVQNLKFWDRMRPHWSEIARLALQGLRNKLIALQVGRSAGSVGRCLLRMYEVGYLNPVEVFKARLKPATAERWAIEKPVATQWGRYDAQPQLPLFT